MMYFEDFYPISSSRALVVTGPSYTKLNKIILVDYYLDEYRTKLKYNKTLISGKYLRLGSLYKNELIFSDEYGIYSVNDNDYKNRAFICKGIQPYKTELGLVYQKEGCIFLNHELVIKPWDNYLICGRPTLSGKYIYFEARSDKAPQGWKIWRFDTDSKSLELILMQAANPFVYGDRLFFSYWNQPLDRLYGSKYKQIQWIYQKLNLMPRFETNHIICKNP